MRESLQAFIAREGKDNWDIAAITTNQPAVALQPTQRHKPHPDARRRAAPGGQCALYLLPLRVGDERLALLPMCHLIDACWVCTCRWIRGW